MDFYSLGGVISDSLFIQQITPVPVMTLAAPMESLVLIWSGCAIKMMTVETCLMKLVAQVSLMDHFHVTFIF